MTNAEAVLNDLVREAYEAQEAFDNYDSDKSDEKQAEMGRLYREFKAANLKLVLHVIGNGLELIAENKP